MVDRILLFRLRREAARAAATAAVPTKEEPIAFASEATQTENPVSLIPIEFVNVSAPPPPPLTLLDLCHILEIPLGTGSIH